MKMLKGKGKILIMPAVILLVLIAIYVFNSAQKNDSAIVYADGATFIEASGTVENNLISVSSEVTGTVLETMTSEGDLITKGDTLVIIENTALQNQYNQSLINQQLAEENIIMLEGSITNLTIQNADATQQAHNAYLSAKAEYDKVMDGASEDEIKQAEETLSQAKTNLDYAKTNLDRSKELFDEEAISQSKYDEALKTYNVSEAQYNVALSKLNLINSYPTETSSSAAESKMLQLKAGYELSISNGNTQLRQLESQLSIAKVQLVQANNTVEQTKRELDKLNIKSPIDGVVNSLFVKEGEFATAGKLTAEIFNPENIEINAYVSEANIGRVIVGQETVISIDSYENEYFTGKVTKINNLAEFTPKNIQTKEERVNTVFKVTIKAIETDGALKPGMPADVKIRID
ncbi:MAG: HlyD family efflux transporter periplasmic adaptor subunit [Tissierellia bacterium]|nr:HlyD family efflux transporter periplasmic adaptor subunit [Tissierellia bacterium]HKM01541.1 HlyD family efflux transporter periplasmic adaptor subunit [Sedimentibacter sp.]